MTARVTFYTRPGCHLCDDARAVLDAQSVEYDEIDIESDDELFKRYLERIPVVAIDGVDLFEYVLDGAALCSALARTR